MADLALFLAIVLLIEPVWNRNLLSASADLSACSTSNRTSMESKLTARSDKKSPDLPF